MTRIFKYNQPFRLQSGSVLEGFHLGYTQLGELNSRKDNVVWIFHALTANSDPSEWWAGLVGEGRLFDPATYCIICVNMPGSCYGSLSPVESGLFHQFPFFSIADMVAAYRKLADALGIKKVRIGLGGSMGGQQLLQWAVDEPRFFEYLIPIATNARHSAWGIAFNASQRMAIESDATWGSSDENAGITGMKTARSIALLSYRNYTAYRGTQSGHMAHDEATPLHERVFRAESYQRYQGEKLARRFNAFSYHFLSRGMDSHDVSRGHESLEDALGRITAKCLVISIDSDILFPPAEQEFLAAHIPHARLEIIPSSYGHDGFLLEFDTIGALIKTLLASQ